MCDVVNLILIRFVKVAQGNQFRSKSWQREHNHDGCDEVFEFSVIYDIR